MSQPRVMLAAPSSGSGKTVITCGLLQVFQNRGIKCHSFKCGPDYLDPVFHRSILGVESCNLDSFFLDSHQIRQLFTRKMQGYDLGVMEGVMGYYDGLLGGEEKFHASSYEVATATKTPVILVVDGKGASLSIVAMIQGFLQYAKESRICGVILNRCSKEMASRLKPYIEELGILLLGYVPVCKEAQIESRHLGLKVPEKEEGWKEQILAFSKILEETLDIDSILQRSFKVEPLPQSVSGLKEKESFDVSIGVAMDESFYFYYNENLELLKSYGCQLVPFSPLYDKKIPDSIDGLILGGGYPEIHAKQLSENESMRSSMKEAVTKGVPVLAECGGFLYLQKTLETKEGISYPMVDVIHEKGFYLGKLTRFGYIFLTSDGTSKFLKEGEQIRGHEFHYWDSSNPGVQMKATKPTGTRSWPCMYEDGSLVAGFPHLYYLSCEAFLIRWLRCCMKFKGERNNEWSGSKSNGTGTVTLESSGQTS